MQRLQARHTLMVMLAGLVLTCPAGFHALGLDLLPDRTTLTGLQGVRVVVENIRSAAEGDGLTARRVQTDVELRLRQAGIRVLSKEESYTISGNPYLYINVNASKRNDMGIYAYSVAVQFIQDAWLVRNLDVKVYGAPTWSVSGVGSVGQVKVRGVRAEVLDQVDEFINAYLAVNPEQAGGARRSQGPENLIPEASIIRQVQWQLREAGFEPGQVDGKLGTQTRLALRQYQTQKGLPPTGELDNATSRALGFR